MWIARARGFETREFGAYGLADKDAAGAPSERDHRGVGLGTMPGIDRGAVFGREIGGVIDVLDADRQAAQRQRCAGVGARAGGLDIKRHERADLGLALGDSVGTKIHDRARGEGAGFDLPGKLERREHHGLPSSRAMMRSVMRRAAGMITKAVPAAIGQAMK